MRVIDAHLHLDPSCGDALSAARRLDDALEAAGIERGVVLHLDLQPWSMEEELAAIQLFPRFIGFVNLRPGAQAVEQLERALTLGYSGLKLHPRLHGYPVDSPETVELVDAAGSHGVPVVMDAFPDGTWLLDGFDPTAFGRLALAAPSTRIVAAHFGGHHCIDMMMIAKRVPNLWLDVSYSLLYYRTSRVPDDLVYACRSLRFERVMYGSDYPDRPVDVTLEASLEVLRTCNVDDAALDRLLYGNAAELFPWPR